MKGARRAPPAGLKNRGVSSREKNPEVERGLGKDPPLLDGGGNARDRQIMLRWSRDYSKTWSNEYQLACGQAGQFRRRVRKSKMGSSKTGMVFELSMTDPIPWRLVEAYLEATPGFVAQERL